MTSVTFSMVPVLSGNASGGNVIVPGYVPTDRKNPVADLNSVRNNFFHTLKIPILRGRSFLPQDQEGTQPVAIVNQAFAKKYFDGKNPAGRRIGIRTAARDEIEIIGVVADIRSRDLKQAALPTVYRPFSQSRSTQANYAVRITAAPQTVIPALRQTIHAFDSTLAIGNIRSQQEQLDRLLVQERLLAFSSYFFGSIALTLAALGLYGTSSYNVARRTSEIGIRMALGASPGEILCMIIREAIILVAMGIFIGLVIAIFAGRLMFKFLYGVSDLDPLVYVFVSLMLVLVTILGAWMPAQRAANVDPLVAIRS